MNNLKKKNIILMGLIVALVVVSYANYSLFYKPNTSAEVSTSSSSPDPINATLVSNLDEEDVMNMEQVPDEFFTEYRMNREKTRSKNIEALENITTDPNIDKELLEEAINEMVLLVQTSEQEMIIENLIKAKGFSDAIIFIHADKANVIVKADSLQGSEAIQIQDIVSRELEIELSNIVIATSNNNVNATQE